MIRVPHAHEGLLAFWKQFINVKFIIISKCPYMSTFRLLCNLCSSAVDGIAYRTRCAHLFCPTCAKATFQRSTLCSICNVQQHETDVHEIKVGIAITDDMLRGVVFQYLLQNTDWEPIRDKLNALAEESLTTTNFVATQLLLAANSNSREKSRMELELSNQADHLARLNQKSIQDDHNRESMIASYETQLRDANKALVELEEAYKEKLRKCQAWEKAYNNVRSHLAGTGRADVSLTSRDAALLESEAMQRAAGACSKDDDSLSSAPNRKTLRTEVSTYRNVTTHRLPANVLPAGVPAAAFSPTVPAFHALSPRSDIRDDFPLLRGSNRSAFGGCVGAVPDRMHEQSYSPNVPAIGYFPPHPQPSHPQHQNQQQVVPHIAQRERGSLYVRAHASSQAPAPAATRKRSFFDNET